MKVVIIGANSFQNRLILKAKDRGYETHVFAWKCGDEGEKSADFFYPVSITEKDRILEMCKTIKPNAVISVASDLAMLTVNHVAENLGLVCNSPLCTELTTDKFKMRKALHSGGISTPVFALVDKQSYRTRLNSLVSTFFCGENHSPVIVKPTDRSGSRGITKLETPDNLEEALRAAFDESFSGAAIVEEYLQGKEYSCECISFRGRHYYLALTKKFTTGAPHFIETGHIEPSSVPDDFISDTVVPNVFKALDALKITNGASHSEFKVDSSGNVRIIEVGARMGGDCIGSDLVELSTGYDYLGMVLDTALGLKPQFKKLHRGGSAEVRFILSKDDLRKLEELKRQTPQLIYRVSDISEIKENTVTDSSTRFGYYILFKKGVSA